MSLPMLEQVQRRPAVTSAQSTNEQKENIGLRWNRNTQTDSDALRMWQRLQSIMDYKGRSSRDIPNDASLPDKLDAF
jgi:hypothetical protein